MDNKYGVLFDKDFQESLKEKFFYVDEDPKYGKRLFFENSGGSLRLKKCVEAKEEIEKFPDCPERIHERSLELKSLVETGTREILEIIFGVKEGSLITELAASQAMFHIVGLIMENIPGTNAVVSSIEHPSAFDAIEFYCKKTGKEMRVVPANKKTGGTKSSLITSQSVARPYIGTHIIGAHILFGNCVFFAQDATNIITPTTNSLCINILL